MTTINQPQQVLTPLPDLSATLVTTVSEALAEAEAGRLNGSALAVTVTYVAQQLGRTELAARPGEPDVVQVRALARLSELLNA